MKSQFKKLSLVAALTMALAGTASASMVTVGGVQWDPSAVLDFRMTNQTMTQSIDGSNTISGFGRVDGINGDTLTFCPGCELTFQYGGFTQIFSGAGNPDNWLMGGGWVKFYVDYTPETVATNPNLLTAANTGDEGGANALWLSLAGHSRDGLNSVSDASITYDGTTPQVSSHRGVADVVGGLAASWIDQDSVPVTGTPNADLRFSFSFEQFPNGNIGLAYGTGSFSGDTLPEPGSLALVGLSLFGLGALRRRRVAK